MSIASFFSKRFDPDPANVISIVAELSGKILPLQGLMANYPTLNIVVGSKSFPFPAFPAAFFSGFFSSFLPFLESLPYCCYY